MGAVMAENFSDLLAESARLARASLAALERVRNLYFIPLAVEPMPEGEPEQLSFHSLSEGDFLAVEGVAEDANSLAEIAQLLSAEFALIGGEELPIGRTVFAHLDGLKHSDVYESVQAVKCLHGVLKREGLTDATEHDFYLACFHRERPVKWLGNTVLLAALSDNLRRVGLLADRRNDKRMVAIFRDASGAKIPGERLSKKRNRKGYSKHHDRAYLIAKEVADFLKNSSAL